MLQSEEFKFTLHTDRSTGWDIVALHYEDHNNKDQNKCARIVPAAGANMFSLMYGSKELLYQPPALKDLPGYFYGTPLLYPTPNRVRNSTFNYNGDTFKFDSNENGNFLHGLILAQEFEYGKPEVVEAGVKFTSWIHVNSSTAFYKKFPIEHNLRVEFLLEKDGIRISYTVQNTDDKPLPYGFALHPYFNIFGERKETLLWIPAEARMEAEALLPTGTLLPMQHNAYNIFKPTSLDKLELDDVFYGMVPERPSGYKSLHEHVKVSLQASEEFTHAVVFTPSNEPFFCIENQTCSADAHNLHSKGYEKEAHLLIVPPHSSSSGSIKMIIESI